MSQLALLVDGVVSQFFSLESGKITIGRSPESDICIDDASVSTNHAVITVSPSEFFDGHFDVFIEDLKSRNGTLVNGESIEWCRLQPEDVISIGWNKFKLLDDHTVGKETTVLMVLE